MTRPLGKSPARSRIRSSQLDLNQVSLIDVCAEDDSLLPGKGITSPAGRLGPTSCPRTGASPFKVSSFKTLACIQEDQPESDELPDEAQDVLLPLCTGEPAVKKKKKSGFNLRKSLAWNNAFFTEEGVLDPDELSLVNRTFKKPHEEPKPPSNKKPAFASKILNTSAISKLNFSPARVQKAREHKHHGAAPSQGSPSSSLGNTSKRTDQHGNGMKGAGIAGSKHTAGLASSRLRDDTIKHAKSMLPTRPEVQGLKPSPVKKHMEETRALPARSSTKPPLNQTKNTSSISSTLSSASRMMKDRLGMVFAGRTVNNTKAGTKPAAEDDTVVPSYRVPDYSDSAKLTRCYSHSSYERFGRPTAATTAQPTSSTASNVTGLESRASSLQGTFVSKGSPSTYTGFSSSIHQGKTQAPSALFSQSHVISSYARPPHQSALESTKSITRETGASESDTLLSRAKPSGLRMPSPKLGFFDKARTTNAASAAVLRERTNGLGITLQSTRYLGAGQLPNDVSKQSNSGYAVIPQAMNPTSRQLTVSNDVDGHAKQIPMTKPPIPSTTSGQPRLEHRIHTTSHLPSTESSSEPDASSIPMAKPPSKSSGQPQLEHRIHTTPHLPSTESSSEPASSIPTANPPILSKSSGQPRVEHRIHTTPHLPSTESSSEPDASLIPTANPPIPSKSSGQPRLEHWIHTTPHLPFTENSSEGDASSTLPKPSEVSLSAAGSVPTSSTVGSSSISLGYPSETNGAPSLASDLSGNHDSDTGAILKVKKNVQNMLPAVKKMVNKLNLSPLQITGQENVPLEHPHEKGTSQYSSPLRNEKACSQGDIGEACKTGSQEEWPQMKSGAVQHSPPNKEPPKYGPWSPVRRNAPELGPFDCTKYTNNIGISH